MSNETRPNSHALNCVTFKQALEHFNLPENTRVVAVCLSGDNKVEEGCGVLYSSPRIDTVVKEIAIFNISLHGHMHPDHEPAVLFQILGNC